METVSREAALSAVFFDSAVEVTESMDEPQSIFHFTPKGRAERREGSTGEEKGRGRKRVRGKGLGALKRSS